MHKRARSPFRFWEVHGCAGQFKNKWIVSSFPHVSHSLTVTSWTFFATAHGKGLVDVIGGRSKATVWMNVRARNVVVKDASDFFEAANRFVPGITFLHIPECIVRAEATISKINDMWANTPSVVGIRGNHHFVKSSDCSVLMSPTSTSLKRTVVSIRRTQTVPEDVVENENRVSPMNLAIGNWVAFRYENREYRGLIQDLPIAGRVTVASLEATSVGSYKWPNKEDVLDYPTEDILRILNEPVPVVTRSRLHLRFPQ